MTIYSTIIYLYGTICIQYKINTCSWSVDNTELYRQVREGTNECRVYKIQAVHWTSHNNNTNSFINVIRNRIDPARNLALMPKLIFRKLFQLTTYTVCNKMIQAYIYCSLSTVGWWNRGYTSIPHSVHHDITITQTDHKFRVLNTNNEVMMICSSRICKIHNTTHHCG